MGIRTSAWWVGALAPVDWSVWLSLPSPGIRIDEGVAGDEYVVRVTLPPGAREDSIRATYRDGVVEITVKIGSRTGSEQAIPVEVAGATPE